MKRRYVCDISSKEKHITSSLPKVITGKLPHSPLSSILGERTDGEAVRTNCASTAEASTTNSAKSILRSIA